MAGEVRPPSLFYENLFCILEKKIKKFFLKIKSLKYNEESDMQQKSNLELVCKRWKTKDFILTNLRIFREIATRNPSMFLYFSNLSDNIVLCVVLLEIILETILNFIFFLFLL